MLGIGFLGLIIVGYGVVDLIASDLYFEEKLSLSYGMGVGFISLFMFLMFYFKLLDSATQLIVLLFLIALILFISNHLMRKSTTAPSHLKSRTVSYKRFFMDRHYKLYLCLFPLFIVSVIFAYYYPITIYDGVDYELTGRLMAFKRAVEPENYFRPYPPLIPVTYAFIYLLGGSYPKIIFPFFYLSLAVCFYFRLVHLGTHRRSSLIFTLVLATTPYVWWHSFLGILNLTAAYYFSIASFFWFFHLKDITHSHAQSRMNCSYPLLAGFFYSFSIFTRFEMLAYVFIPVLLTAYYSLRYRLLKSVVYLTLPSLGSALLWYLFSSLRLFPPSEGFNFTISSGAMLISLLAFIISYVVVIHKGSDTFIALVDKFPFGVRSLVRVFGMGFVLFLVLYFFMPDERYHAFPLVSKAVLLLSTLATTTIAFLFGNIFYLATSLLIVFIPTVRQDIVGKEQGALGAFILLYVMVNITMYSFFYFSLYAQGSELAWHYEVAELVKTMVSHPGNLINDAQFRGLLPLYPIAIFFFAVTKKIHRAFEV